MRSRIRRIRKKENPDKNPESFWIFKEKDRRAKWRKNHPEDSKKANHRYYLKNRDRILLRKRTEYAADAYLYDSEQESEKNKIYATRKDRWGVEHRVHIGYYKRKKGRRRQR
jgi:hypothetical protein